jgi:hypothetical protein
MLTKGVIAALNPHYELVNQFNGGEIRRVPAIPDFGMILLLQRGTHRHQHRDGNILG